MNHVSRILVTMGEPAGVGPELLVKIAQQAFEEEIIVLANSELLANVAKELDLPLKLEHVDWDLPPKKHCVGRLLIENIRFPKPVIVGVLDSKNSPTVLNMLTRAGELALTKKVDAVVTAPVHKAILNQSNPHFLGHTEFFADQANVKKVVMMLATHQLRMALVTTHIPLAKVSEAVTQSLIVQIATIIQNSFTNFGLKSPKIAVCGLNPHAGEDGLLGMEDKENIAPAVQELKAMGVDAEGPFPSDSLFTKNKREIFDVFLAMYHDQGLPVVKAIGFGECANITLGLPYIRTSVDHGTAIDIAPQRIASSDSLSYAINYAIQLAKGSLPQ